MSLRTEATEPLGKSIVVRILSMFIGLFMAEDQDWN